MSLGKVGSWPIDAPNVLDVHAYLYFDGRALFVQSADAGNPAKGNGQAIATTWQQIEIPCTLEIGKARLVYRLLQEDAEGDEDKTIAQAVKVPDVPPPQFRAGAGAFSNRNSGPDSDATRIQSMDTGPRQPDPTVVSPLEAGTPSAGVPMARPAAGMPAGPRFGGAPMMSGGAPAPPPPAPGYQGFGSVQVAMGGPQPMNQTLQQPMQSPLAGQPQYGMPPQMMGGQMQGQMGQMQGQNGPMPMGGMGMPQGPGPHAETGKIQPPPNGFKEQLDKAIADWKAMPPIRKIIIGSFPGVAILAYMMLTDQPQPQMVQRPMPPPSASVTTTTTTTTPPPPTTPVYTPPPVTSYTPPPNTSASTTASTGKEPPPMTKGARTLERQAIDLAMQGQYAKAAELYDQLAAQHPDNLAFKEAAFLLRQRINGPN